MSSKSSSPSTTDQSSIATKRKAIATSDSKTNHANDRRNQQTLILSMKPQKHLSEYYDKVNSQVIDNDNDQTMKRRLVADSQQNQTLCSNGKLTDPNQSTSSIAQTNNENRNRQSLSALPTEAKASAASSSTEAKASAAPSSTEAKVSAAPSSTEAKASAAPSSTEAKVSAAPSSTEAKASAATSSLPQDEFINILLLGESGVGKSTFINALVNYLTFETLDEAESGKSVALIPVSFLMTTGENFSEQIVKLEVSDPLSNENFEHPGQSVTQRCQSYVFQLKHPDGKKLRIIDTPGFGDTRGLEQDDFNMEHILEYINHFTHLNAVCFLLKPNESRLNIFFRTCLTQLLDFVGSNIHQNIIFCFTNSRPTFYTPGDTAPLLKVMLKSISTVNIPFRKENAYCFDSESFRYLVARKSGITFNNQQKYKYEASWVKSVIEFNRFLDYIRNIPTVYRMNNDCKSIKHACREITHMIRPILETIRNLLRNIILSRSHPMKKSIVMKLKPISHPVTICLSCKHKLDEIGYFWFLADPQHDTQGNNHNCSSASKKYIIIDDYILNYNLSSDHVSLQKNERLKQVSLLINASAIFSNFVMHNTSAVEDDQFFLGLTWMLDEEKYICNRERKAHLNKQLSKELEEKISEYRSQLNQVQQNETHTELSTIYNLIHTIQDISEVHIQLATMKKTQEYPIEKYEKDSDPKNASFSDPVSF